MRTLLTQFCDDFGRMFRPIGEPLGAAATALAAIDDEIPAKTLEHELLELQHHVRQLADKVAEQQAYVMIFGPLKSGKSTLMNALCGSYVSEVSSLPAYPCMVFVSHAETREFTVTLYDGETLVYDDEEAMHAYLRRAHGALADAIRDVERAGGSFDPAKDLPGAVRRIDVRLPAGDLAQSGAVLVDTPGLYSRMKFGYDRMTREFRNGAACAVFVVRSDNLFLEQVFDEFTRLLELFSRIFLVVNLDTCKQDLGKRGELVPSLEQRDPGRLLEIFEQLSMSAPLKAAAEEGRLRLYPVGLLPAASARLTASLRASAEGEPPSRDGSGEDSSGDDRLAGFGPFLRDLTEYLESPDYLVAFLGDSLRRAEALLHESRQIGSDPRARELALEVDGLERQRDAARARLDAAGRLTAFDWNGQLDDARAEMREEIEARIEAVDEKTARAVDGALHGWFRTSASLDSLVHDDLEPLFTSYQEEVALIVERALTIRVRNSLGGLRPAAQVTDDLRRVGVDLDAIARTALDKIDRESLVVVPPRPVRADRIPVRRRLWDWVLLRRRRRMSERIFGPVSRPDAAVPPEVKRRRLGRKGYDAIHRSVQTFRTDLAASTLERLAEQFIRGYTGTLKQRLELSVAGRREAARAQLSEVEPKLNLRSDLVDALETLRTRAQSALRALDGLTTRYRGTDPDLLLQTLLPDDPEAKVVLPAPPPRREVEAPDAEERSEHADREVPPSTSPPSTSSSS